MRKAHRASRPDRPLGEDDVGRDDIHPGGDRPGVEVVTIDNAGCFEDVPAYLIDSYPLRSAFQQ